MAVKVSTGLRNYLMDTGSAKGAMTGCYMKIYSGAVPASADASVLGNTVLCVIYKDSNSPDGLNWEAAAVNGVLSKSSAETWGGSATANGTATFFRLEQTTDDGDVSTSFRRVQGECGIVGADLNLSSLAFTTGAPQLIDSFSMVLQTY